MERLKKHLLVALGFAFAGMIGAAFGTKPAQAIVATLVEIVNPATSPVRTSSVDDPGRVAYQSQIDMSLGCSGTACTFTFPLVPAGHRVVVQHITGIVGYNTPPTVITVSTCVGGSCGSGETYVSNFYAPIPPGLLISQFDWPALVYVDSSTTAVATVELFGNSSHFGGPGIQKVTLTGYELDCTVAACAPIATQ
jgi:hypothetical protein